MNQAVNELVRPQLIAPPDNRFQRFDLTKSQLGLVADMNRDLTSREFDQFIETSRALGLNPLKRQICTIVFNKKNAEKRSMSIITTIHGFRAIADRSGCYRPDDQPARITYVEAFRDPKANPLGIDECVVTPYRHAHGEWHPVIGQVWWDEIAPIREWDGERKLDTRTPWPARPRGQIIKCSESDALRRGWPEDLANVYTEDEVDRARILDITPSEAAAEARTERLLAHAGGKNTIILDRWDGKGLTPVQINQFHDTVCAFLHQHEKEDPSGCLTWLENNRVAFQQFFAHDKDAALDLKARFEGIEKTVADEEAAQGDLLKDDQERTDA